jgi:hypothetical protein
LHLGNKEIPLENTDLKIDGNFNEKPVPTGFKKSKNSSILNPEAELSFPYHQSHHIC